MSLCDLSPGYGKNVFYKELNFGQRAMHSLQVAALMLVAISASAESNTVATHEPTPPPISGRSLSAPDTILAADVLARLSTLR